MIELTLDKKQLKRFTKKLNGINPRDRAGAISKAFRAVALETEKHMKTSVLSGQVLKARTGRLRASIGSVVTNNDEGIVGLIGSGVRQGDRVPYANIHETGGILRPKIAKYLAIPLKNALTAAGALKKKPREWANTFVTRSKNGNLFIMQHRGKRGLGAVIALFLLKKSVKIPARHYMERTKEAIAPKLLDIMTRSIDRQIEGATV